MNKRRPVRIWHHGTKKGHVDEILKDGFKDYCYFSWDLSDAIEMGGDYVFGVWFYADETPDNWQIRCADPLPVSRIVWLRKYDVSELYFNKKTSRFIRKCNKNPTTQPAYCFNLDTRNKMKWKLENLLRRMLGVIHG